jgi:hypothetical protein
MITNATRQRTLRGHAATHPTPRAANTADHQATLALRLTARDRWIIRMLHEHRVLTVHQVTACAFPSVRSGRLRLRELFQWSVVDRFQPFITRGTSPMHYVLGPAGAAVLAAEDGLDVKELGYRHDRAIGVAHSLRLAHTVGVSEWFTALIAHALHTPDATVDAWWSETRCGRHFGDLITPDAFGRFTAGGREIEFFLEYDFGTEVLAKLAGKLTGYAALAQATGITTPLLVWLPTARREAAARRILARVWQELDDPRSVPVATATAELLDPATPHPSPAAPVWLPLDASGGQRGRRPLHHLPDCWPRMAAPAAAEATSTAQAATPVAVTTPGLLPPPDPMPPARAATTRGDSARTR